MELHDMLAPLDSSSIYDSFGSIIQFCKKFLESDYKVVINILRHRSMIIIGKFKTVKYRCCKCKLLLLIRLSFF